MDGIGRASGRSDNMDGERSGRGVDGDGRVPGRGGEMVSGRGGCGFEGRGKTHFYGLILFSF